MAQVPYKPFPTEQPSERGPGGISVSTPIAAFGGAVGQALEGLSSKVEGASNELFTRALAIQNLRNETEAREADSKYMIAAGQAHADFNALEGKARVDAFPGHMENLQKLRTDIRDKLSNPMAQKMYDSQSLSTMGRTIFNAAGAAASANKQWAVGTAKAQIDLDAKTVEDNPQDEVLYQAKKQRVLSGVGTLSALQGFETGGAEEQDLALKATSQLRLRQLIGLSRTQPFEAGTKLEKYRKDLTEDDYLKADNTITTQARAVGSANIAQDIYREGSGDDKGPSMSLKDMEDEARKRARALRPNDPIMENHAVAALHGIFNQDKYAKKQEDWENGQIIDDAISKGVRDERELRLDPRVAAAVDALPKDKRLGIPGAINRFNAARDKVTNQDTYQRLYGLSNNDVEAFLNTDLTNEKLGQSDMKTLMGRQQKLKENQNADPRVSRAQGWIRGAMGSQLEALGIFSRTKDNKDDYDHYTGALQSALDVWQEAHKKPPTYEEVTTKIAPEVLKQRDEPGWLWGTNKTPFFKQEVPDKWKEDLKADIVSKGGSEPTEEQLYKAYTRMQYIKLYGAKKDDKKAGPAVPVSQ